MLWRKGVIQASAGALTGSNFASKQGLWDRSDDDSSLYLERPQILYHREQDNPAWMEQGLSDFRPSQYVKGASLAKIVTILSENGMPGNLYQRDC